MTSITETDQQSFDFNVAPRLSADTRERPQGQLISAPSATMHAPEPLYPVTSRPRAPRQAVKKQAIITHLSALGFLALGTFVVTLAQFILSPITILDSVINNWQYDQLWSDSLHKQMSGYSMLAIFSLGLLFSLRRRVRSFAFGHYFKWRIVHALLGFLGMLTFIVHTGFRLGSGLNLLLASCAIAIVLLGSIAACLVSLHQYLPRDASYRLRRAALWTHIILLWPLPVLMGFHIVAVYYF